MAHKTFCTLLILFFGVLSYAQPAKDSTDTAKKTVPRKGQIKSTIRIHSKGMFLYGGRISTDNPALDINFTYNRPKWGFFIYKALDMQDHTSPNNFSLIVLFKNFKLSERITFTPHIGTFLEQAHSVADFGSDFLAITVTTFKINPHLSIDHTALFPNLVVESELLDWVNRARILFVSKHIDVTTSFWHNNHVFDEHDYTSGALTVSYSRIRLSDTFNLSIGATEIVMLNSSDEESVPKTNRFLLTVAVQFVK